jgi:hypothetical protein
MSASAGTEQSTATTRWSLFGPVVTTPEFWQTRLVRAGALATVVLASSAGVSRPPPRSLTPDDGQGLGGRVPDFPGVVEQVYDTVRD